MCGMDEQGRGYTRKRKEYRTAVRVKGSGCREEKASRVSRRGVAEINSGGSED